MKGMDWFDLAWHGLPWVLLLRLIALRIFTAFNTSHE